MSNTKQTRKNENEHSDDVLGGVIERLKAVVGAKDVLVLVDVGSPEVSGVVVDVEGVFRDVVPLGEGVHIVLSVGDLETVLEVGIHELG